ncbi:MAG: ankyrin repeat domain-containing protein [Proteobacteria bacterium]|nr:ankyrin repeat domain-containing protein [Pseudomonadota bacterium]
MKKLIKLIQANIPEIEILAKIKVYLLTLQQPYRILPHQNTTALMEAVKKGFFNIVSFLVENHNLDVLESCEGRTALSDAICLKEPEISLKISLYLISRIKEPESHLEEILSALYEATQRNQLDVVKAILGTKPYLINSVLQNGKILFVLALEANADETAEYLLSITPQNLLALPSPDGHNSPYDSTLIHLEPHFISKFLDLGYSAFASYCGYPLAAMVQMEKINEINMEPKIEKVQKPKRKNDPHAKNKKDQEVLRQKEQEIAAQKLQAAIKQNEQHVIKQKAFNTKIKDCIKVLLMGGAGLDIHRIPERIFELLNFNEQYKLLKEKSPKCALGPFLVLGQEKQTDNSWKDRYISSLRNFEDALKHPNNWRFNLNQINIAAADPNIQDLEHIKRIREIFRNLGLAQEVDQSYLEAPITHNILDNNAILKLNASQVRAHIKYQLQQLVKIRNSFKALFLPTTQDSNDVPGENSNQEPNQEQHQIQKSEPENLENNVEVSQQIIDSYMQTFAYLFSFKLHPSSKEYDSIFKEAYWDLIDLITPVGKLNNSSLSFMYLDIFYQKITLLVKKKLKAIIQADPVASVSLIQLKGELARESAMEYLRLLDGETALKFALEAQRDHDYGEKYEEKINPQRISPALQLQLYTLTAYAQIGSFDMANSSLTICKNYFKKHLVDINIKDIFFRKRIHEVKELLLNAINVNQGQSLNAIILLEDFSNFYLTISCDTHENEDKVKTTPLALINDLKIKHIKHQNAVCQEFFGAELVTLKENNEGISITLSASHWPEKNTVVADFISLHQNKITYQPNTHEIIFPAKCIFTQQFTALLNNFQNIILRTIEKPGAKPENSVDAITTAMKDLGLVPSSDKPMVVDAKKDILDQQRTKSEAVRTLENKGFNVPQGYVIPIALKGSDVPHDLFISFPDRPEFLPFFNIKRDKNKEPYIDMTETDSKENNNPRIELSTHWVTEKSAKKKVFAISSTISICDGQEKSVVKGQVTDEYKNSNNKSRKLYTIT